MSKIRESARGEECQIRSPRCNNDPETTVLCHLPSHGMGMKAPDWQGAYGCSACHDLVDSRRVDHRFSFELIKIWHYQGVIRTIEILIEKGLITIEN